MARQEVIVNVYDMCSLNSYMSKLGVGVFHSGVQVYNTEFGYGGHPFQFSGVFEIEPKDDLSLGEDNFKYRESIVIGHTDFSDDEIREIVNELGNEFQGSQYHLLHKNCNHFTDSIAKTLTGRGLPSWVNRLAFISTCVPFLERCLPKEFLTPAALEQSVRDTVAESGGVNGFTSGDNEFDRGVRRRQQCSFSSSSNNHSSTSTSSVVPASAEEPLNILPARRT